MHSTYFQLLVVKRDWRHHFFSPVEILVNDCLRGCQASERFVILLVSDVSVRRAERCLIENVRHVSSNLILRHVSSNLIYLLRTYASFCLHLFDRMKSYAVGLGTLVRVNLTLIAQVFQDRIAFSSQRHAYTSSSGLRTVKYTEVIVLAWSAWSVSSSSSLYLRQFGLSLADDCHDMIGSSSLAE